MTSHSEKQLCKDKFTAMTPNQPPHHRTTGSQQVQVKRDDDLAFLAITWNKNVTY